MSNSKERRRNHRRIQREYGEKLTVLVVDWRMTHGWVPDQGLKDAWMKRMRAGQTIIINGIGWASRTDSGFDQHREHDARVIWDLDAQ
jgi:hypothetical protein